jgi:hypothetical protein
MDFFKISNENIYNDKELLKNFLSLYSEKTGEINLNASCLKCINDYKQKLYYIMNTENKNYIFAPKYDGIFFVNDHITNDKLTDEIAEKFIKTYVNEANPITEFFSKFPEVSAVEPMEQEPTEQEPMEQNTEKALPPKESIKQKK